MKALGVVVFVAVVVVIVALSGAALRMTISQRAMTLQMVGRVQDEGATRCRNNGGLKGVEWAYDTTPEGWMPNPVMPAYKPPGEVADAMDGLALNAPKPFLNSAWFMSTPKPATYVCRDGSMKTSEVFNFVP